MSDHTGAEGRRHWRGGVAVPYDDLEAMEDRAERAGLPFRWEPAGSWRQMISDGGRAIVWIGDPPKSSRPQCGAKTRKGTPCQARAVAHRTRCRMHGGLSTGPTTEEGRAKIAESNRRRAEARRMARAAELAKFSRRVRPHHARRAREQSN